MKKIFSLVLAVLLLFGITSSFSSCNNKGQSSSTAVTQSGGNASEVDVNIDGTGVDNTNASGSTAGNTTTSKAPGTGLTSNAAIAKITNLNGRKIKIGMSDWQGDKSFKTEMGKYLFDRITAIQNKYNCTVEVVNIPDFNPVFAAIQSGNPPFDILYANGPHQIPVYMKGKLLQPLDDLGINFSDTRFNKTVTDALTFNGKHYGLERTPQGLDKISLNWVALYNKRLITEDLNAVQDAGNWTWDKLLSVAKSVTKDTNSDGTNDIWGLADNGFFAYSGLVASNNADWIAQSGTKFTFNAGNANAMEALEFYQKLAKDGAMKPSINGEITDYKDFRNGKVGIIIDYANRLWSDSYYKGMADNYGILYMPKGPKASDYMSPNPYFFYYTIPTGVKNVTEVGAVMNELLAPLIPAAQETNIFKLQCESYSRDAKSKAVLMNLATKTKLMKFNFIGNFLQWGPDRWYGQLENITKNNASPAAAVTQNQTRYDNLIADNFNFS